MKSLTKLQKSAIFTFIVYLLVLVWVITLKCNMEWPIYVSRMMMGGMSIPERAEWSFCHFRFNGDGPFYSKDAIEDMLVNVVLFLPVGMTLPMAFEKKKYLKAPLAAFGLSLAFEISQFFNTIGGFAYIDLITNTLGAIVGMIVLHFLLKVIKPDVARVILTVFTVIFGIIVIYGTVNTINNIHIYL